MNVRNATALLQLAGPRIGSEVSKIIRELARIGGVKAVAPSGKIPRLLRISYDPKVVAIRALFQYTRRTWAGARLV
jgi:hypothetical protein